MYKKKQHEIAQAVAELNSQQIHRILRFGATPQTKHEEPGARKPQGKPGTRNQGTRRMGGYRSTAVAPAVDPKFCSFVQ